jgi:hypothetical protein
VYVCTIVAQAAEGRVAPAALVRDDRIRGAETTVNRALSARGRRVPPRRFLQAPLTPRRPLRYGHTAMKCASFYFYGNPA